MAEFINTVDILGDSEVASRIISRTITEYNDNNVSKIGGNAFRECTELLSVNVPFAETIEANAFRQCSKLSAVYAPTLLSTGINGFYNCPLLHTVYMPSVTYIEMYTFQACTSLTNVDVSNAETIKQSAFDGCKALATADLPAATSIGIGAFSSCYKLTALILRSTAGVCTLSDVFALRSTPIDSGKGYIYVPRSLLSDEDSTKDYRRATNWSAFANQFRALEDYTVDGTTTGELDPTKTGG